MEDICSFFSSVLVCVLLLVVPGPTERWLHVLHYYDFSLNPEKTIPAFLYCLFS